MKHLLLIISVFIFISCISKKEKQEAIDNEVSSQLSTETLPNKKVEIVTKKSYYLDRIMISLTQIKGDGIDFYCKSKMFIYKNDDLIDSLNFNPEPVGGSYGISKPIRVDDHLIFTKHGDYDGRTLIVNNKGKVSNIIGGINYYDSEKKLLFTIYESDLSGFAVFDLKNDTLMYEMEEIENYPISFHKAFGERYFMLCSNEDPENNEISVWEIELENGKIAKIDLDKNSFNEKNILKKWESEDVSCQCDK